MSARDELAEIIGYTMNNEFADPSGRTADALLAAGYRKLRTITTTEELEALLIDSVIKDRVGDIYERVENSESERSVWRVPGIRGPLVTASIMLPATVLHEPEVTQ